MIDDWIKLDKTVADTHVTYWADFWMSRQKEVQEVTQCL
jgi:hypothetical protein